MTPSAVRVFGTTILATAWLSASLAQSGKPSLRQIKVIAVRSDSNSELGVACLPVLTDELLRTGRTISETADGADGEMVVRFERHDAQPGVSTDSAEAYYSLRLWNKAPRKVVWSDAGSAPLRGACKQLAKTISAHLKSAMKTAKSGIDLETVPVANPSKGDATLVAPAGHVDGGHPTSPVSDLTLPILMFQVDPKYPAILKKARIEGRVLVQAVIDEEGNTREIEVIKSSHPGFNDAAIASVKTRKYSPARKDGHAVAINYTIRVDFRWF
jgi:TonB family protein